ncbi:hypothetical protein [Nocardia sp. NRRL S-836]|uniref:hypothetical protein n=1 Tax=Nocardia sp. NRRL S-836 TaxID=1519492 RepID=UPI0006AF908C|nr:hypothetical protein [Nocardia sp. NRRL S-836]
MTVPDLFGDLADQHAVLERMVRHGDDESVLSVMRVNGPALLAAYEALLAPHQPDERGRCTTCRRHWRNRLRRPRFPCRVVLAAHQAHQGIAAIPSQPAERSG